mmetsp:Transcript_51636/g.129563  ORF Transcript_51636/g.129563 Transcript_51636/m.129563 type:complete len:217 (-) Transcript_51636:1849-2499(-)
MGDEALPKLGPGQEGTELASLDFENLIGGPMIATIKGQIQANLATVNFIKAVGFEKSPLGDITPYAQNTGKPAYVNFEYSKVLANGNTVQAKLAVPFLTMLPIPTIRIESLQVEFLARVDSTVAKSVDTSVGLGAEAAVSAGKQFGIFGVTAGLKVSAVLQRQTKEGNVVTRNYSLSCRIKASQDELPPGLDKVMQILEQNVRELDKSGKPLKVDG